MKKVEVLMSIEKFERALKKLKEGIEVAQSEIEKDGVIQRFEFTFEIFWKTLKVILRYKGIEARSPRSAIKEAFKAGLIKDDEIFLDMLEDRNLTSHIYDENSAEEVFQRIKNFYVKSFEEALVSLKEEI